MQVADVLGKTLMFCAFVNPSMVKDFSLFSDFYLQKLLYTIVFSVVKFFRFRKATSCSAIAAWYRRCCKRGNNCCRWSHSKTFAKANS